MPDTLKQGAGIDTVDAVEGLYAAVGDFFLTLAKWEGEELLQDAIEVRKTERPEQIPQLIGLALPPFEAVELSRDDKQLALDLAAQFGRERAQWFYHLAVLVTKLA